MKTPVFDLAVIGGGINGCGIARDAAGRGLSVFLCEQQDLANGTSSASTKLIHGGLRYLEHYEFRLVREALTEREVLLRAAPHIIWPLRFILPHHKGLRPSWLIRLGLFIYDNLGGRKLLPGTTTVSLRTDEAGKPLKGDYTKGFEYSDCWVMDSRLVVLNAMDARERGADIRTRCTCTGASRSENGWTVRVQDSRTGQKQTIEAKVLVNASGPWLDNTLNHIDHSETREHIRMVKGSHIIVKKIFDHSRAYIFQNADDRIIFAIPYQKEFTLIGTTDVDFSGDPGDVSISEEETRYLCDAASEYFTERISPQDVASSFSGIRPLFDDGKSDAKAATRDYVLKLDLAESSAPLLSIYGGKITTYRKLAESVLEKLAPYLPKMDDSWTENNPLPGGDFPHDGFDSAVINLLDKHTFLEKPLAERLFRLYGTRVDVILSEVKNKDDMGRLFGSDLYEFEVKYLIDQEWAKSAEDILWRRSRLGLFFSPDEVEKLQEWINNRS